MAARTRYGFAKNAGTLAHLPFGAVFSSWLRAWDLQTAPLAGQPTDAQIGAIEQHLKEHMAGTLSP